MKTFIPFENKKQTVFMILISFSLIIFSFYGCNEITEPTLENTNHAVLNKTQVDDFETIKAIAKGLSVFLKKEDNREMLRKEIDNSEYFEGILESSEFLYKKGYKDKISKLLTTKDKEDFLSKSENIDFGKYDIYFPLKEWREEWKSTDDLYIGAVGYRSDDDKSDFLAYDLKGNEIYLSSTEIPSKPTLVIYPSEKRGRYTDDNGFAPLSKTAAITAKTNYTATCTSYRIEHNHDTGFLQGDMEIYFMIASRPIGTSNWTDFQKIYGNTNTIAGELTSVTKELVSRTTDFVYKVWVFEEDNIFDEDDEVAGVHWVYERYMPGQQIAQASSPYLFYSYDNDIYTERRLDDVDNWGDETYFYIELDFPDPLIVSMDGPATIYGSNSTITKRNDDRTLPVQSGTATWTANAVGGVGVYSYVWYYKNTSTSDWNSAGITTQSYTRTIYSDTDIKCEVTSGSETSIATKSISFIVTEQ